MMNIKKYTKILILLSLIICSSQKVIADERDTFDVLMTDEEKAAVEDLIERSKNMSSEAQSKLQEALDAWGKFQDHYEKYPEGLQNLINQVNGAGLKSKIGTTIGGLKKFDSGLQSIMDKKEKIDQVIGIYDRYVPDVENPFRSLEVLENLLTDIESYALPKEQEYEYLKNTPVFLIRTAIRYFKEGIKNAHGGLKNIQKGIRDRAGNCLGYVGGDEYGDPNDPKRKAYEQINIGEVICYTGVRPVGGEVWKDMTGNLVYVWYSGSWTKLDCGFGTANKVFKYWKLANGTAISGYDLIYWCTGNYVDVFAKALSKGEQQFNKIATIDGCQEKILDMLSLKRDLEELMRSVSNNKEIFTAKYIFKKDGIREAADLLVKMAHDIVYFEGIVKDAKGNGVAGANVSIEGSFPKVSIDTDSRGYFEILAEIPEEDQNRLRLKINVKADDYKDLNEKTRLQSQCMDLGVLSLEEEEEECGKNEEWSDSQERCVCKDGYVENSKGDCVEKKDCAENEHFDADKDDCICDEGFTENSEGVCIKIKECKENEHWDADIGDCICDDGYSKNEQNFCVKEKEEEIDDCSIEYIKSLEFLLQLLVADTKLKETELISNIEKFNKEINDQSSDACNNQTVSNCYATALRLSQDISENIADIEDLTIEILLLEGICPDLSADMNAAGITIKSLISSIAGLGGSSKIDKIDQMAARLRENGCDEEESEEEGEKVVPPDDDPGFGGDGGWFTEIPGDGDDNDGDGQQDEEVEGLTGYNITLVLYDSGSAKDDVFNLSVGGYGSLGQTPAGGLRSYGLNLPPGSYTATVTVISAPDDVGTYTLSVLYNGESIGSLTGSPPQGSSGILSFTVPSE